MQNDGGIKRGDRAGAETGHVTAASDSLAEPVARELVDAEDVVDQAEDLEDFYVTNAAPDELDIALNTRCPPARKEPRKK